MGQYPERHRSTMVLAAHYASTNALHRPNLETTKAQMSERAEAPNVAVLSDAAASAALHQPPGSPRRKPLR
jgi:hypothetical protein